MNATRDARPLVWDSTAVTGGVLRCLAGQLGVDLVDVEAAVAMLTRCWDAGTPGLLAVDLALVTGADDPWPAVPNAALQDAWSQLTTARDVRPQGERAIA